MQHWISRQNQRCYALLILLLLFSFIETAKARPNAAVLRGEVQAKDTGQPLPGAHVFLAGSSYGDITDEAGQFTMGAIPAGSYRLIVTMLGFSPVQLPVELSSNETVNLVVELETDIYDLKNITVEGERPSFKQRSKRRRQLTRFKRLFLGNTRNRKGCDLINPEVLQFTDQDGVFSVAASVPLIIENRSLGYRITYKLDGFNAANGSYRYIGEPFFEELEPKSERTSKQWARQREKTFNGSLNHYLRSLAAGRSEEEGFKSYLFSELYWHHAHRDIVSNAKEKQALVSMDTLVSQGAAKHEWLLQYQGYLHVLYMEDTMPLDYYSDIGIKLARVEPYTSALELIEPLAGFNEIGFLNNPFALSRYGFWNWESGVCNNLPFNYGL